MAEGMTAEQVEARVHELKCEPPFWWLVSTGRKNFEVRRDDRDFKVGDRLVLREWNGEDYTGRTCERTVAYVLRGVPAMRFGLHSGYAILGLTPQQQFDLSSFRKEVEENRQKAEHARNKAGRLGHDEDAIAYGAEVIALERVLALLPAEEES